MHCCNDLTSDGRVVRRWGRPLLDSLCKPTSRPWLAKYCLVSLIPLGNAVLETVSSSEVSCQTPPLTRMSMPSVLARAAYFSRVASVHEDHHHVLWRLGLSIIASPCAFPTATHVFATSRVGQKLKASFWPGLA